MIKGLMGQHGVVVSAGNTSVPYVNQNNTNPMQGIIRIWGSDMQVFDGNNWVNMASSYATVGLDSESQNLLEWARRERNRQQERERKMQNNPALIKAFEAIERAEENFELLYKFVEHDTENQAEQVQSSP